MPSKSRKSTVARRPLEDFPAEVREEAAITPSPTAVAAEAQLTGVMPLDGRQGHSAEKEIPVLLMSARSAWSRVARVITRLTFSSRPG